MQGVDSPLLSMLWGFTMKLQVITNIAGEVRLKYHSGGHYKKNGGDSLSQRRAEISATRHHERELYCSYIRSMDEQSVDKLELYDPSALQPFSTIYRSDAVKRLVTLDNLHESHQNVRPSRSGHSWGKPHKPTKLTRSARATIYEAGCVLDAYYKDKTYLTTCTLPGSDVLLYLRLANESGYIIDRLSKAIKKYNCLHYFVWEWQKRGALHLHYALANDDIQKARNAAYTIEYEWFELLLELGVKYSEDFFKSDKAPGGSWVNTPSKWQSKVELVTKSVSRYLSKYLSKANCEFQPKFGFPSRWWGCSKLLRNAVSEHRVSVTIEGTNNLLETLYCKYAELFRTHSPHSEFAYSFEKNAGEKGVVVSRSPSCSNHQDSLESKRLLFWGHGLILHFDTKTWLQKRADIAEFLQSCVFMNFAIDIAESIGESSPWYPLLLHR